MSKRGSVQIDNARVQCPQDGTILFMDVDGQWKDGDRDGRVVYSMNFVCPECKLLWGLEVKIRGYGAFKVAKTAPNTENAVIG